MRFGLLSVVVALFGGEFVVGAAVPAGETQKFTAEELTFFEKQVRPLLTAKCFECHGPKLQEAGLRLDSRSGVLHGMEGSPAAVPGDPAKSRLIAVIKYDGDVQMPPDGKLGDEQMAVLTNWVKLGLPWPEEATPAKSKEIEPNVAQQPSSPWGGSMEERIARARAEHWAFQPVRRIEPPPVADPAWNLNPIDRFVAAQLATAKLQPSPEADPAVLIRRLYFDLLGLPPSAGEVEAFVRAYSASPRPRVSASSTGDAETGRRGDGESVFAALVDELLASPRYGERWARHWLDVARYADTKGYAFQQERRYPFAYTYRDYVIRAFNEDLPYDQFILEQLAADKLPPRDDNRSLAALGFITCGREYQGMHDTLDDQIDVVTRGLLGLTASCARCHDHKFDPIPTDDYYSLYGVFRSSTKPTELPLIGKPTPSKEYDAFVAELAKLEGARQKFFDEQAAKLARELRSRVDDYLAKIVLERLEKSSAKEFEFLFDAGDPRPPVVTRWRNLLEATKKKPDGVFAAWHALDALKEAEFAQSAERLIAEWSKSDEMNRRVVAELKKTPPKSMLDVAKAYGTAFSAVHEAWEKQLAEKPMPGKTLPTQLADTGDEALRQVLYGDKSPTALTTEDIRSVFDRTVRNEYEKLKAKAEEFVVMSPAAPPRAMTLVDLPGLYDPRVFLRGDASRPERAVPRQFPRILAGDQRKPFADGSGRLDLAKAIASRENPLTARVMVNRIWMLHFGRGLVETPSDFGVRTPPPSHPELLDYLATEFMNEGWSVKRLHRLIVTSATYRQSSLAAGLAPRSNAVSGHVVDPENRLLWRQNRRRLELEPMRDSMLAVAGRLDVTPFGRPVELWTQPYTTRRTVYGFIDRQDLPGVFGVFDFANPDVTIDLRPRTTVPQQALFAMNSPFVLEQARYVAAKPEVTKAADDAARIEALYRAVLGRRPDAEEAARVRRFLDEQATLPKWERNSVWRYGYGDFDVESKKLRSFTPFEHFVGASWQAGPKVPHPQLGHASLNNGGGHPGRSTQHAAVMRWTSPIAGRVVLEGLLKHPSKDGDGVAAHVTSSRLGSLGEWTAQKSNAETKIASIEVRVGDVLDFIVEPRKSDAYDAFQWTPTVKAEQVEKSTDAPSQRTAWSYADDFQGPLPPPQTPWEMLAQVLLMSNEFVFVD